MSIINRMRKQNAIYWPPAAPDDFGRPGPGVLVELVVRDGVVLTPAGNYRVRWEDKLEQFLDKNGAVQMSSAIVYVPKLPDGSEVLVGGYLWLGDRADLISETDPRANVTAEEIKRVEKLPTLKATETLRTCYL